MAISSISMNLVPSTLTKKLNESINRAVSFPPQKSVNCTKETTSDEESNCKRRLLMLGIGALTAGFFPARALLAEEIPQNYSPFVDTIDGYSYVYPADWRVFDFNGHDSAFKDRFMQLQNVRVRFIPTQIKDVHDLGPLDEVVTNLVTKLYAAPSQVPEILSMEEKTIDGKNYYTFEYQLTSRNYASCCFATIAVANGRFYTLVVGANERRWKRYRNRLKVVADSFKVLDI